MAWKAEADDPLPRLVAVAEEQLRWHRAAALPGVRDTIDKTLTKTKMRCAYEMLDGENQSRDIAEAVGVSPATISQWATLWRDLGIAYDTTNKQGHARIKRLVSLKSLQLPIELADNANRKEP
jgi:hypothetical protein